MKPGDRVRFRFRTGKILRLERRNGQPGDLVMVDMLRQGDGFYPQWVPLADLREGV